MFLGDREDNVSFADEDGIAGVVFGGEERALTAYVAGTTGVLIGADLLRINDIRQLGAPSASIGGAGTFDGIFLTGIVAVLLA